MLRAIIILLLTMALPCFLNSSKAQTTSRPLIHEFQSPQQQRPLRMAQVPSRPIEVPQVQPNFANQINNEQTPKVDRLDRMEELPRELLVQDPSPEIKQKFNQFIERTIDPENRLTVIEGRPRILIFKSTPIRIYLPDEEVASYQIISDREIAIVGIKAGTTALNIWVEDPTQPNGQLVLSYLVEVVPDRVKAQKLSQKYVDLSQEINDNFPNSYVELKFAGNQLLVIGQAHDSIEAMQILQVISANAPQPLSLEEDQELAVAPLVQTNFSRIRQTDEGFESTADEIARRGLQTLSRRLRRANVVNMLRIPGDQQVMLKVTVAEVNRTAARRLGMDWAVSSDDGLVFASTPGGIISDVAGGLGGGLDTDVVASLDNGQVILAIQALRQMQFAKTLAEPTLTTLNGRNANLVPVDNFLSLQQPSPAMETWGQGVTFIPFGVELNFTPNIVDRDRIRLSVNAQISTRDDTQAANIGGTAVPGLDSNDFQTTVELREGQTLAVAGLIQHNFGSRTDRIPFFGDLPLLGPLTGSNETSASEIELVVLITPQLVHPINAHEAPALPGDDMHEPTDFEFFLHNRLESRRSGGYRSPVRTDYHRQKTGNRCDAHQFLIGPTGRAFNCSQQSILYSK